MCGVFVILDILALIREPVQIVNDITEKPILVLNWSINTFLGGFVVFFLLFFLNSAHNVFILNGILFVFHSCMFHHTLCDWFLKFIGINLLTKCLKMHLEIKVICMYIQAYIVWQPLILCQISIYVVSVSDLISTISSEPITVYIASSFLPFRSLLHFLLYFSLTDLTTIQQNMKQQLFDFRCWVADWS